MNLWIDDIRPMPDDYDIWAKNADEAVEFFQSGKVTHASFDHDLGMQVNENSGSILTAKEDKDAKTGYDVATWIEREAFRGTIPPFTYNIHSANPIGAKHIEMALKNAERYWNGNQ